MRGVMRKHAEIAGGIAVLHDPLRAQQADLARRAEDRDGAGWLWSGE